MTGRNNLAIEYVPIDQIKINPKHARKIDRAQIERVKRSIRSHQYNVPLLAEDDWTLIAGHVRLIACRELGMDEVPVIRLSHLSPAQAQAFAIAENRLVETGAWDPRALGEIFSELSDLKLDFSLEDTGFQMGEIDLFIDGLSEAAPAEEEILPEPGPSVTRPGDLWVLGEHRLICGSSLEVTTYEALMDDERASVVFTDPPYNVPITGHVSGKGKRKHREFAMAAGEMSEPDFNAFLHTASRLMADWSADGSLHYVCMDWRHLHGLLAVVRSVYDDLINICVWSKSNGGMGSLYRSAHEMVVVARKGAGHHRNNVQLGRFGRNRTNVWNYPGANTFLRSGEDADLAGQHPTPKPVQLVADALLDSSARGDVVLDPFGGSGSTLLAAERTGRRCRMIELDPAYCDLIIRRWRRHGGGQAVRSDGALFDWLELEDAA